MVAFPLSQRLILPVDSTAGGFAAVLAGAAVFLLPADGLEAAVMTSGLPAILAAAEPPLGVTARAGLATVFGTLCGMAVWALAHRLVGRRTVALPLRRAVRVPAVAAADPLPEGAPIVRRADAHPDAPPRRPLMAQELGTPFLDVTAPKPIPVEQPLPADLDAPLAAFDPAAIPDVPAEPVRAVAPLYRAPEPIQAPGERFETFELPREPVTAISPSAEPMLAPRTEATVHALLERLERGVAQRVRQPKPAGGLQDTLAELRSLAARA